MRMIRVRVEDEDFDYLVTASFRKNQSLAGFVRDLLHAFVAEVSEPSDTTVRKMAEASAAPPVEAPAALPPQRKGVGRPTAEQWERLNKWLAATGRQPEEGEVTTRSGLLAWAVGKGFQP